MLSGRFLGSVVLAVCGADAAAAAVVVNVNCLGRLTTRRLAHHHRVATRSSKAMNTVSAPLVLQILKYTPKGTNDAQLVSHCIHCKSLASLIGEFG